MSLLNLLDIQKLSSKNCYRITHPGSGKEPKYIGKLKSTKPSDYPGHLECKFDGAHYTGIQPNEKQFILSECLDNYEELKKEWEENRERDSKSANTALEACGIEKCRKAYYAKKNARNKLNNTKKRINNNINRFFDYDECIEKECKPLKTAHALKLWPIFNNAAYRNQKTRRTKTTKNWWKYLGF